MALFATLRALFRSRDHLPASQLAELQTRLQALEDQELRRSLEWAEVSEKLKRYLQRISAVEQRAKARENGDQDDDGKAGARALLMRTKFGQQQGS